ncbi:MAG TPA: metal ABC transporter permease [Geminicoccus sp.]|jgi:manganese/zinc/iron transport system permease protein|uniref:metal ABC transporter permease n=1 Tax=Geminicoccus sp. TaxID=2024832 RepID=UPI002E366DC6|nr:metal ABC transporter permease [Geminicoccus sp.]HEX2529269.1 metal ABC transporter permease [Geminicoccus sp.]
MLANSWNLLVVLGGVMALGISFGILSPFLVLQRRALIGDVVAHAALPGTVLGFLGAAAAGFDPRSSWWLWGGAIGTGALAIAALGGLERHGRLRRDAAMAAVLATGFGLGTALLSLVQQVALPGRAGLGGLLLGQAASMQAVDLLAAWAVMAAVLVVVVLLWKELLTVTFDPLFAKVAGLGGGRLEMILMALLLVAIATAMRSVGLVLLVALLVLPGVTARLLTDRMTRLVPLSAFMGALAALGGTLASTRFADLPTGAATVLAAATLFAMALAVRHGWLDRATSLPVRQLP